MTYSAEATAASEDLDGELDEFLGALTALGGSAGNVRLRVVLEWDDAAYNSVKAVLVDRGLIVPGRGRGGSVALAGEDEGGGRRFIYIYVYTYVCLAPPPCILFPSFFTFLNYPKIIYLVN